MIILLDTHILLWALGTPRRLSEAARLQIAAAETRVLYSAASIWEIAIKSALGKIRLPYSAEEIMNGANEVGFTELPVTGIHAAGVAALPLHHRDPFDRLLVAQALATPARLLTADARLAPYSELVQLV